MTPPSTSSASNSKPVPPATLAGTSAAPMHAGGHGVTGNGLRQKRAGRPRVRFDAIDLAILNQLQSDCEITNATLAQRVGISPPSTLERVKKLVGTGIIKRYVALIDPVMVDKSICALVHVTLREHGERRLQEFKDAVGRFEEVQEAWHTAGEEDFILKVLVTDMTQYETFIVHKLSMAPNIGRIRTSFALSTIKDETRVPLDAVGPDAVGFAEGK
jgi:Lrp/AsnC family leucine-responsive transcriptional regulator